MKRFLLLLVACTVCTNFAHAQKISYQGEVSIGYGVGIGEKLIDRIPLHIINGVRLNDHVFVGLGTGIEYYCEYEGFMKRSTYAIPVFANIKGYLPISKHIAPFASVDLGYSVGVGEYTKLGGLMITPAVGVKFGVTEGFAINLSVGYSYQKLSKITILHNGTNNAFTVKVGFQF